MRYPHIINRSQRFIIFLFRILSAILSAMREIAGYFRFIGKTEEANASVPIHAIVVIDPIQMGCAGGPRPSKCNPPRRHARRGARHCAAMLTLPIRRPRAQRAPDGHPGRSPVPPYPRTSVPPCRPGQHAAAAHFDPLPRMCYNAWEVIACKAAARFLTGTA